MRISPLLGAVLASLVAARSVGAQSDTVRAIKSVTASWHLQATGSFSHVDRGFGNWTGEEVRLLHSGPKFSPFASVGSQTRPNGTQAAVGLGSYVNLTPSLFAIVGVGVAPDRGVVLFPRLRSDASIFVAVPGVKGVLVSTGFTDLRYSDARAGGQIWSVGSTVYHGRGIYSAGLHLNSDRASGARSSSWEAGGQWGAQGSRWVGVGVSDGTEAYQVISTTPFDARFRSQSARAFVSQWVTKNSGVGLRVEYEHKIDVYHRGGLALSYFVDF